MPDQEPIGAESLVDDVLRQFPTAATVFIRHHMHCVGCEVSRFESLAGASQIYGVPLDTLLAELREAAGAGADSLRQRKESPAPAA